MFVITDELCWYLSEIMTFSFEIINNINWFFEIFIDSYILRIIVIVGCKQFKLETFQFVCDLLNYSVYLIV